jgi:hypothetical protein
MGSSLKAEWSGGLGMAGTARAIQVTSAGFGFETVWIPVPRPESRAGFRRNDRVVVKGPVGFRRMGTAPTVVSRPVISESVPVVKG